MLESYKRLIPQVSKARLVIAAFSANVIPMTPPPPDRNWIKRQVLAAGYGQPKSDIIHTKCDRLKYSHTATRINVIHDARKTSLFIVDLLLGQSMGQNVLGASLRRWSL